MLTTPVLGPITSHGRPTLLWSAAPGAAGYLIERAYGWGPFKAIAYVAAPLTSYIDNQQDGSNGFVRVGHNRYRLRAVAADGQGNSPPSSWVDAAYGTTTPLAARRLLAATANRLVIVDPEAGTILGATPPDAVFAGAAAIVVVGTRAYVRANGRLLVVNVTNPAAPVLTAVLVDARLAEVGDGPGERDGGQSLLAWSPSRLLVSCFLAGTLLSIDVSDPTRPRVAGEIAPGGVVNFVSGQPLCLARLDATRVLWPGNANPHVPVVDVTDPDAPALTNAWGSCVLHMGEGPCALVVDGRRAIVAVDVGGLCLFDLADPAQPVCVGALPVPAMTITPTLAYDPSYGQVVAVCPGPDAGAAAPAQLVLLDVTVSASPRLVRTVPLVARAAAVVLLDRRAVVLEEGAVVAFDLDQPDQPPRTVADAQLVGAGALAVASP